jgi:hypothetical protein
VAMAIKFRKTVESMGWLRWRVTCMKSVLQNT